MGEASLSDEAAGGGRWQVGCFVASPVALVIGGALTWLQRPLFAHWVWTAGACCVLIPTVVSAVRALAARKQNVDLIAILAMAGALALREALVAAIIAVMLAGGIGLERFAVARARRELNALLQRAPRVAHRRMGGEVVDVAVAAVTVGDELLVKPGEVVPADGVLAEDAAVLDESALSGESKPVRVVRGAQIRSGASNCGAPFEFRVTAPAAASTYAGIVRLVQAATASKAPLVRLADRYASLFLGLTLTLAALSWFFSGSAQRALAVLVVATPCPLILAAPAAIIAGVSRAAKFGIIVKGGGPLETLARVTNVLLDKTGTVTAARPQVVDVVPLAERGTDEFVRLAASLEQVSVHPYAPAILTEASSRHLSLTFPRDVDEQMGAGLSGVVDGERVAVGQLAYVAAAAPRTPGLRSVQLRTAVEGSASAFVSIAGELVGAFLFQDPVRPEAARSLRALRTAGVERIFMVTGDHPDIAELVGDALGIDRVFAERTPEEKVDVVKRIRAEGVTAMVGDGINDAPALALADVGIAMGARGATAASEAADVVLTMDRLEGLPIAVSIAQRTRRIALQSVLVGMGLSIGAMVCAALGYLGPVMGAVLQEAIDVLVILNALRALGGPTLQPQVSAQARKLARGLAAEHRHLRPHLGTLLEVAARLETLPPANALASLRHVQGLIEQELLPHERGEETSVYPLLSQLLADEDPTGPLIQTHRELQRLARLFARLLSQLPEEGPGPTELGDLRRVLYGLHAILSLHFAQEDELYAWLDS